ncbi:MAG: VWA domain-containing protein, partial [Acidobacteriota bacterium]
MAERFFDTVDIEIINVEVYVTDRKGEPVYGLGPEDFEITHDGEPVEISNFFASSEQLRAQTPAAEATPSPGPDAAPTLDVAPPEPDPDQQLNLLLFIDNRNISPKNRNRAIEAIRGSVVRDLRPQDRVTVVSFDGRVEIHETTTGDAGAIDAALERVSLEGASGVHAGLDRLSILRELQQTDLASERRQLLPETGFLQDTIDWDGILNQIRAYTRQEFDRTATTIAVLGQFVDTLAGMPGRKALIYVSDGISLRPGETLINSFMQKVPQDAIGIDVRPTDLEGREYDATHLFEDLGRKANASRVTFYTILAAGGTPQTITPAEQSAFFNTGGDAAQFQVWNGGLQAIENANVKGSMQIMAESTGGLATLSTRNFGQALARIQRDFSTYYSLGYEAPDTDSFDDHRIRVNVRRDGLKVRHRESYRLRSAQEHMEARTQSALLFEDSQNPLGVKVEFGPPKKEKKGLYLVPVIVKFPINRIVLAPGEHSHQGQVSIFVGARNLDGGGFSPVQRLPAPVTVPNDRIMNALGQVAGYRMMLHLR